jgi:hypothetical protein
MDVRRRGVRGRLSVGEVFGEGREGGAAVVGELGAEDDVDDEEVAGEVGLEGELTSEDAAAGGGKVSTHSEDRGQRKEQDGPDEVGKVACEPADEERESKTWKRRGRGQLEVSEKSWEKPTDLRRSCSSSSRRSDGAQRVRRGREEEWEHGVRSLRENEQESGRRTNLRTLCA